MFLNTGVIIADLSFNRVWTSGTLCAFCVLDDLNLEENNLFIWICLFEDKEVFLPSPTVCIITFNALFRLNICVILCHCRHYHLVNELNI